MKVSPFTMEEELLRYFDGERTGSVLYLVVAAVAILVSVHLLANESDYRFVAAPLLVVAALQLVAGGAVFLRTPKQVTRLAVELDDQPEAFRAAELPRMERVQRNFRIFKVVEIVLILAGILLTYLYRGNIALYSVGIGLIAQGAAMLVFDLLAERRADLYVEVLRNFS